MSDPYTGGCACGAISYSVSGDPVAMVDCQCRQCQRDSGKSAKRTGPRQVIAPEAPGE